MYRRGQVDVGDKGWDIQCEINLDVESCSGDDDDVISICWLWV